MRPTDRHILKRLAEGWRPMATQIPHWRKLERLGVIRLDHDPENTIRGNPLYVFITEKGRQEIAGRP